ncbi:MAG: hypothetical protein R3B54_09780 [Bdellovibrionota bacterium]
MVISTTGSVLKPFPEGTVALLTGGRIVKIGYQCALMLLRAGSHVIVTTCFPRDAVQRFAREEDYES